ncbi:hypothetical protein BV898_06326 [Hypsibius exemplaris]|uniref:G-protein coupled receptors family 2 profile 2 domain-containing protein n=1 Tax=Hypsibius exemplaris TaxID=2072580 RepID=A0A1W0WWI9_HYPEX|nr:hypothetical protein BV898_06326 [Hypsibius exemplaris]
MELLSWVLLTIAVRIFSATEPENVTAIFTTAVSDVTWTEDVSDAPSETLPNVTSPPTFSTDEPSTGASSSEGSTTNYPDLTEFLPPPRNPLDFPPDPLDDICSPLTDPHCGEEQTFDSEQTCESPTSCVNLLTNRTMFEKRCFCDKQCETYGDCCRGRNSLPDRSVRCVGMPFYANKAVGVYARTECLDRSPCEADGADPFSAAPVFGKTTRLVYRNLLCALCNNEHFDELAFGQVELTCNEAVNISLIEGNMLRFFADEFSGNDSLGVKDNCTLSYGLPKGFEGIVKCIRSVDSCPANVSVDWSDICSSYLAPVTRKDVVYKNPHCAVCNGVPVAEMYRYDICFSPLFPTGQTFEIDLFKGTSVFDGKTRPTGYSMTIFLDLNLDDGNTVGTTQRCPDGQVFDPWTDRCRKVSCSGGRIFVDGRCIAAGQVWPPVASTTRSSSSVSRRNRTTTAVTTVGPTEENAVGDGTEDGDYGDGNWTVHVTRPPRVLLRNDTVPDDWGVESGELIGEEDGEEVRECPELEFPPAEYVIEGTRMYVNSSGRWYNLTEVRFHGTVATVCLTDEYDQNVNNFSDGEIILSIVCYTLSLICLGMHFFMYIMAGKYRLVPDLCMLSISLAIFLVQIFVLAAPLAQRFLLLDSIFCAISGVLLHYCILSSITWSTVIAYDITKSVLSLEHPSFASVTYTHFVRYSLFAWLAPGVPVVTGLIFDATLPDSPFSPIYGKKICYVGRRRALWVLFGAPVALLLTVNIILYIVTATALWKSYRRRRSLNTSVEKPATQSASSQYRLYVKLAMIMGLAWITGFLAIWVLELRYVSIIANGLQGVYIFFAFSCKWSIVQAVTQRRPVFGRLHSSFGSNKSSLSTVSSLSTGKLTGKTSNTRSTSSQEAIMPAGGGSVKSYGAAKETTRTEQYFLKSLYSTASSP